VNIKYTSDLSQPEFISWNISIAWEKISGIQLRKLYIALGMMVFLCSCSISKIHLFKQGVEPAELDRVSAQLRTEGFKVKLNELQSPEFDGATMIYSPAHPKFSEIDKLLGALSKLGYPNITPVAVSRENNSYTGKNIGLYLGQPDPIKNTKSTEDQLPMEFSGYCFPGDAYLILSPGGGFKVNIFKWNEKEQESEIKLTGNWKRWGDTIELVLDKTKLQFQIEDLKRFDGGGLHRSVQLTANKTNHKLTNCKFVHNSLEDV